MAINSREHKKLQKKFLKNENKDKIANITSSKVNCKNAQPSATYIYVYIYTAASLTKITGNFVIFSLDHAQ